MSVPRASNLFAPIHLAFVCTKLLLIKGWHSSDGWSPAFVFGQLPADGGAVFAHDAGEIAVGSTAEDNDPA